MPVSAAVARVCALSCVILLTPLGVGAEGTSPLGKLFRTSTKAPTVIDQGPVSDQGPVAKACGLRKKSLGKVVEKGPGKWKLYDTAPGSTAARDFYLTGFSDGCPRRVNGAVAVFGSVELYELVHYGPVGMKPDGAATDTHYARLRAKACGSSGGPCKQRGVKKLSRSAIFVNVYPSAGSSTRYELLMNRGRLAAVSKK